jgi:hypothetical protein
MLTPASRAIVNLVAATAASSIPGFWAPDDAIVFLKYAHHFQMQALFF